VAVIAAIAEIIEQDSFCNYSAIAASTEHKIKAIG